MPDAARLTVIEQLHYQHSDDPPVSPDGRFSRALKSTEQHFFRIIVATEEWKPLAAGCWLTRCSRVMVLNREGGSPQVIPTEAERAETAGRIVDVSLRPDPPRPDVGPLSPGESFEVPLESVGGVLIRCRKGQARCHVYVFPE